MNPTRLPRVTWTWQELKRSVCLLSGGFWDPDRGPYRHTPLWDSVHPSYPLLLITGPIPSCPLPICPLKWCPLGAPTPCSEKPPVGRFRMRMMGPPRHNFPPHRLPVGPRGEEPHWREQGPERGPDRFGNEPPFHRGGWVRGGPRGRSRFGNWVVCFF